MSRKPLLLTLLPLIFAACGPAGAPLSLPTDTPTPTESPSPTATVIWFPPTDTPTPFPTPEVTPTEDFHPGLGEILFTDDFSTGENWLLGKTSDGSVAMGKNELTIAISEPRAYAYSLRQQPIVSDFYVEIIASPTLCQGVDEYGLLFRVSSPNDFYRYGVSCDGQVRLDRVVSSAASSPQPWMNTGVIPPGAPNIVHLAVWANGKEMRFFANDVHQFTVMDPLLPGGNLGVFARSAGDNAVTVSFSDLVVRAISP